jgi:hypothetical protein
VEAFRVLVFGIMVNPMPKAIFDAFWATASWGEGIRRLEFEFSFRLIIISIDEIEFVMTLIPEWFIEYNEAVEAGDVSITGPCPCDDF